MGDDLETSKALLADIIEKYQNYRRDEGAFPLNDHRTTRSEHRLWLAVEMAKEWLHHKNQGGG